MRGRHNHGVRQALFLQRRKRYLRRRHRSYRIHKNSLRHQRHATSKYVRYPKWVWKAYGVKQTPRRQLLRRPVSLGHGVVPIGWVLSETGGGGRSPPHWHILPTIRPYNLPHRSNLRMGFAKAIYRVVNCRGHKDNRLRGIAWKSAAAFRYFMAVHQAGWPGWDPDHRLPVFP